MSSDFAASGPGGSNNQSTQTANEDLVSRVPAHVQLERRLNEGDLSPAGARVANTKFWVTIRDALFESGVSVGAAQMEDLATAIIHDDPVDAAFSKSFNSYDPPSEVDDEEDKGEDEVA
ncbi:hypothetical protein JG688_00017504 [Phytophthora aleatoria]|uniref:Uncharacterized protein n=1 Tax=Phytophthora aleatoria TaxID=2496075 RepID=A0A8J5M1A2_9STRA|nr:hypothetical protein JG688_00017504 [Phytophthora aleatoria]